MSKASWAPQAEALRILGDERNEAERTFIFRDEDHTLGNALRHVIMQECVPPAAIPRRPAAFPRRLL
jgi:DNA-directed RNA polymerase alpha subunit